MTIEAAVRFPKLVTEFWWPNFHLNQFFKIANSIRRDGVTITVRRKHRPLFYRYAWVTSLCFDKSEYRDLILPLAAIRLIPELSEYVLSDREQIFLEHIRSLCRVTNAAGPADTLGVEQVAFSA